MQYRFLILSVFLHLAVVAALAWKGAGEPIVATLGNLEVDMLAPPVSQPTSSRIVKASAELPKSATAVVDSDMDPSGLAEDQSTQSLPIQISAGSGHPYLSQLWKILLHKKGAANLAGRRNEVYIVQMKIQKSGKIELVEIQGPDSQVSEHLKNSLMRSPEVPKVPDEITLGQALTIRYSVYL